MNPGKQKVVDFMRNLTDRELKTINPYLNGLCADVNAGRDRIPRPNVVQISPVVPSGDFIMEFEKIMFQVAFDTIFLNGYLAECRNVIEVLKSCVQYLNTGGRLVILEDIRNEPNKRCFLPIEIDGLIGLFDDYFATETQFEVEPGKSYCFVYRRLADKPKEVANDK